MGNPINDLQQKINEYKKQIESIQKNMHSSSEEDRKKYDFALADVKTKLNTAQSELKSRWGNSEEDMKGEENVEDKRGKELDDITNKGSE